MQVKAFFIFALLFVPACAIPYDRPIPQRQSTETLSAQVVADISRIVQESMQAAVQTAMDRYYVQHAQALDRLTAEVQQATVTHTSQHLDIIQYIMKLAPVEPPAEQQSLRGQGRVNVPYDEEEHVSAPYDEEGPSEVPYNEDAP